MVKDGNFTLFNADWGAIIIGGSLEVGELLKSRGWWAPTQPTPPGGQTLVEGSCECPVNCCSGFLCTKLWFTGTNFLPFFP